ncbi:MAG: pilus assembly protein TadG-related protein, partial [Sphingobium sp.]
MKTARSKPRSFLTRLGRNEAGNTLAIVAAAVLPLAGMIGGALDISRAYLVKTRLSQACDAGVLAGRRMMGSDGTLTSAVTTEVQKFVNFNFPQGYMGTTTFAVTPSTDSNRQVILSLQTTVPTAIMRLFGKTSVAVNTSCTARNDYSNIDIVLVLDTTG